jgi:hypothetical protein
MPLRTNEPTQRDNSKPVPEFSKAADALDSLARKAMRDKPGITYKAAFDSVLAANPALAATYGGTK